MAETGDKVELLDLLKTDSLTKTQLSLIRDRISYLLEENESLNLKVEHQQKIIERQKWAVGRKAYELLNIFDISRVLSTLTNFEKLIKVLLYTGLGHLGSKPIALYLLNEENTDYKLAAAAGATRPAGEKLSGYTIEGTSNFVSVIREKNTPIKIDPDGDNEWIDGDVREMIQEFQFNLLVPMSIPGQMKGILFLGPKQSNEKRLDYTDDDLTLLKIIAGQGALAIENAWLYHQLQNRVVKINKELEAAYNKVSDEKNRIAAIIYAMNDGLLATNQKKEIVLVNTVATDMLNLNLAEVLKKNYMGIQHYEICELLDMVFKTGESANKEIVITDAGADIYLKATATLVKDENEDVFGALLILQDITDFKLLDTMKSDFISTISHELRTPLSGVTGAVDLLIRLYEKKLDEKALKYVNIIHRNGRRLTELINDLLDLSALESGRFIMRMKKFFLVEIARRAVEDIKYITDSKKGVSFQIDIPEQLEVYCDRNKILQVFYNLLSNAIKYTPGDGWVKISARTKPDNLAEISVEDNGVGIKKDNLEKIFDKFFRISQQEEYKQKKGGTGLGLAITKYIVEGHSGRIWAESQTGKGSKFTFQLPLNVEAANFSPVYNILEEASKRILFISEHTPGSPGNLNGGGKDA